MTERLHLIVCAENLFFEEHRAYHHEDDIHVQASLEPILY